MFGEFIENWNSGAMELWNVFWCNYYFVECDAFMLRRTFHKGKVLHFDLKIITFEK